MSWSGVATEGLLALLAGVGLGVLHGLTSEEVEEVCGQSASTTASARSTGGQATPAR